MKLFSLLDYYVFQRFFKNLAISLFSFIIVFVIVDVIEKIDQFLKSQMSIEAVLLFYYYQLPFFISIALPMSILLSTIFTVGVLNKHNELTAIKASGISLHRLSFPLLILGLFLSVGQFIFDNTVVSRANAQRHDMENNYFRKNRLRQKKVFFDVMLQESPNSNIHIARFDARNNTAKGVNIHYFAAERLIKRLDCKSMVWLEEKKSWRIRDYQVRLFDENQQETLFTSQGDSVITLNFQPADITSITVKPEDMNYWELKRFIHRLERNRIEPRKWVVNLHFKIAFAFTDFIVILFGIPLANLRPRQGLTFGLGVGLFAIFIYYGLIKFGQVLGFKGLLPPIPAVWMGNLVFLFLGGYFLYRMRQ